MAQNVNTIVLKGMGHHEEGKAAAVVMPGMGVSMNASGQYVLAATAADGLKFVKEDALQGKTITDNYAIGDQLFLYQPVAGDHIHVRVPAAQNIAIGDKGTIIDGFAVENATKTFEFLESSNGALASATHLKVRIL